MTALQRWFALTFARLLQALAWPIWALVAGGMVLILAGIGLILYFRALEASD